MNLYSCTNLIKKFLKDCRAFRCVFVTWTVLLFITPLNAATENHAALESVRFLLLLEESSETSTPPVADAGPDQSAYINNTITLDGGRSSDQDGDVLVYNWSLISIPTGSSTILLDSSSVTPSFTPDLAGNYEVQLIVNDGKSNSTPDLVTIVVNDGSQINIAPYANAGLDQLIQLGSVVSLDGSQSYDENGDVLMYQWALSERPVSSSASLDNTASATPEFTADVPGRYVVELIVSDGFANSTPEKVSINTVVADVDVNFDNDISLLDNESIEYCLGTDLSVNTGCVRTDLNGTGTVDEGDLEVIAYALQNSRFTPDLTADGVVNIDDINVINNCLGAIPTQNQACETADANGDNFVDQRDVDLISAYLGQGGFIYYDMDPPTQFYNDPTGVSFALDRILVKVINGTSFGSVQAAASSIGSSVKGFLSNNLYIFSIAAQSSNELSSLIAQLENIPAVEFALRDYVHDLQFYVSDLDMNVDHRMPYDTILAERAWELINISGEKPNQIHVGVLDTPINRNHPELRNTIIRKDRDPKPFPPNQPPLFHGTSVAAFIGANNRLPVSVSEAGKPYGVTGIASGGMGSALNIWSFPVGEGSPLKPIISSNVTYQIMKAAKKTNIVNMSFNARGTLTVDRNNYAKVYASIFNNFPDTLFVNSAGNGIDTNGDGILEPVDASHFIPQGAIDSTGVRPANLLVVGATNQEGNTIAATSNYGSFVDIWAPGEDMLLLNTYGGTQVINKTCTSCSAPLVAATAALVQSIDPNLIGDPVATKNVLISKGDTISGINNGALLNVCKSTEQALYNIYQGWWLSDMNFCNVANGDFESDIDSDRDWTIVGELGPYDSPVVVFNFNGILPVSGERMGLLRSNGNNRQHALNINGHLNLPIGTMDTIVGGTATYGSVIYQNATVRKGDRLEVNYDFIKGIEGGNDAAFLVVCKANPETNQCSSNLDADTLITETLATVRDAGGSLPNNHSVFRHTDWQTKDITINFTGEAIITIGIMDEGVDYGAHMLTVDKVYLESNL